MARHRARRQALQLLFQWDLRRTPLEDIIRGYYDSLLVSEETIARPRPDEFAAVRRELPAAAIVGPSA